MNNKSYSSLVAKFYDIFLEDNVEDINYFMDYYKEKGGNVLELATGTGRILVPLLKSGIKIDGLDNSKDMLDVASKKIIQNSLCNTLYNEDMVSNNISKKYDNVFIGCGSFMVLDYDNALKSLHTTKNILKENGELLIDLFIPWDDIKAERIEFFNVVRDVSIDKERCIVYEMFEHKIKEQRKYGTYKYEYYKDNKLVDTEVNTLNIRWYYEKEIESILKEIGYKNVRILYDAPSYSKNECFMIAANN